MLEITQPSLASAPRLGDLHGEKIPHYLQPDILVFHLVTLPVTLPPHTTMKSLVASPPRLTTGAGDAVKHSKTVP